MKRPVQRNRSRAAEGQGLVDRCARASGRRFAVRARRGSFLSVARTEPAVDHGAGRPAAAGSTPRARAGAVLCKHHQFGNGWPHAREGGGRKSTTVADFAELAPRARGRRSRVSAIMEPEFALPDNPRKLSRAPRGARQSRASLTALCGVGRAIRYAVLILRRRSGLGASGPLALPLRRHLPLPGLSPRLGPGTLRLHRLTPEGVAVVLRFLGLAHLCPPSLFFLIL
jgi:hypothetical protein